MDHFACGQVHRNKTFCGLPGNEEPLALDIEGQYPKALALAQANWAQQKEPADAVLLARAAFAAGDLAAVVPLQRWVAGTGWKDVRLAFLLSKVSP